MLGLGGGCGWGQQPSVHSIVHMCVVAAAGNAAAAILQYPKPLQAIVPAPRTSPGPPTLVISSQVLGSAASVQFTGLEEPFSSGRPSGSALEHASIAPMVHSNNQEDERVAGPIFSRAAGAEKTLGGLAAGRSGSESAWLAEGSLEGAPGAQDFLSRRSQYLGIARACACACRFLNKCQAHYNVLQR